MVSSTLTAPLDLIKTRLQSDFYQHQIEALRAQKGIHPSSLSVARASLLHIQETFQVLLAIPRVEGGRALFKGLGPNLVGVVPARAINFYTYGNGKKVISKHFNNGQEAAWVHLSAAVCAGIITGTATNPIWLIKTRLQLDKSHAKDGSRRQYKNALDCAMQTVRKEGIRGLYRGLSASYLGVSESTMQWVLYEQGKKRLAARESDLAASGRTRTTWDNVVGYTGNMFAAGGAKFCAAIATYPHEVRTLNSDCYMEIANMTSAGRTNTPTPKSSRWWPAEIHRPYPMFPANIPRRGTGSFIRRSRTAHDAGGTQRCHHVWNV